MSTHIQNYTSVSLSLSNITNFLNFMLSPENPICYYVSSNCESIETNTGKDAHVLKWVFDTKFDPLSTISQKTTATSFKVHQMKLCKTSCWLVFFDKNMPKNQLEISIIKISNFHDMIKVILMMTDDESMVLTNILKYYRLATSSRIIKIH